MERALPGLRLEWTISDEGKFIPLPQRDAWLAQESRTGDFRSLCNGDESYLVTIYGMGKPGGHLPRWPAAV